MKLYDVTGLLPVYIKPGSNLGLWASTNKLRTVDGKPCGLFAVCNASLYTSTKTPIGTIIEAGRLVHDDGNGYGVGIIDGKLEFGKPWDRAWDSYLTGYTTCVQGGEYVKPSFTDSYVFPCQLNRIGLARKDGKTFIAVDDRVTLEGFARKAIALGCDTLVNLDGGGSRHLLYDGATVYTSSRVPYNALAWYKPDACTVPSPSEFPVPTRNLYIGCRGEDVKWLQDQLIRRGYGLSCADGIFGPNTFRAVVAYQKTWTRWPNGICGPNTRGHLTGEIK